MQKFFNILAQLLIVCIILVPFIIVGYRHQEQRKLCQKLTTGRITKVCGEGLVYEYSVGEINLNGLYSDLIIKQLVAHNFPVVYSCYDSTNSTMLIYPKDFEKYGYKFPDSLKWILPIIK